MIPNRFFMVFIVCLATANGYAQSFHTTAAVKSPPAGTMFIYPERIALSDGGFFNAQRGTMFVPLNRAKENSDVIAIDVYRFPRSAKAGPETPPIFFLHGGPGFAGLESDLSRRGNFEQRWQPLLDISDVVVVGQRGIGTSKPNTVIEQTTTSTPVDQPYDEQKAFAEFRELLAKEKKVWEELGVDLNGFTVMEAAADVDAVRQALGYEKITLWGASFGSHWGMTIMRQYPRIVERAVLMGMEGPDHTYDHPGWYWKVLERVAAEAEAADELKDVIPQGGLINALKTVVKKAEAEPFTVPVSSRGRETKVLLDGYAMKQFARGYSGRLAAWPADVIRLYHGQFEQPARRLIARANSRNRRFSTASYWMLDCGSGITAARLAEFEADPAQDIIGSTYSFYVAGCSVWDSDLGDAFRQNFETEIPTLIVHGTWDTSTPYENALELVPYFKNCKFVTVKRGSHGALGEAANAKPEFKQAVMKFVETGETSQLPDSLELPPVKWVVPELDSQ